jgi:hypothetical protein
MKLTPPSAASWTIALVFGVLGFVLRFHLLRLPGLGIESFWLVGIGYLILLIATLVKGL